jgi:SAM-dependent methyltransferase
MTPAASPWSAPDMVAGFARSHPNEVLMRFAAAEYARGGRTLVDIGCGAARNASPLARMGWRVVGTDLSRAMLEAARDRVGLEAPGTHTTFVQAPMEHVPALDASADLIVAHGIWNLADSADRFRRAVQEAARVARPGAALFVFTFSRHTLPPSAPPVEGETFVFTQFNGRPHVFLTAAELVAEMGAAGFDPDPEVPLTEYNRPSAMVRPTGPVIYEAAFRRRSP